MIKEPSLSPMEKLEGEFKEDEPWNTTVFDKDGNIFGKYVNGVKQ